MAHFHVPEDARVLDEALTGGRELLPLQHPPPSQECFRLLELLEERNLLELLEQTKLDLPLVQGHEPDPAVMELVDAVAAEVNKNKDLISFR